MGISISGTLASHSCLSLAHEETTQTLDDYGTHQNRLIEVISPTTTELRNLLVVVEETLARVLQHLHRH